MDKTAFKIVVVGGGISGLTSAYLISKKARMKKFNVDITILEKNSFSGGATRTELIDGYLCECGPNGFLDNEPATLKLIKMLGMEERLVPANDSASRRFIYHTGKLREIPLNPIKFLLSDIVPILTKIRMSMEYFIAAKKTDDDETVYSFGKRRLGSGFANYLLDPMVSGIFAGNIHKLSLKSVFPKMVEMEREYGGLFKAMFAKKREGKKSGGPAGPGAILHTFKNGMGELTEKIAKKMKKNIKLSTCVTALKKRDNKLEVITDKETFIADAVILSCPSYESAKIIEEIDENVSSDLKEILFAPVDVVCHGYKPKNIGRTLDGFGVLIPRSEGIRSLGTLWSDSIFPGQAPRGHHLLRTLLGGAHDEKIVELERQSLDEIVQKDLSQIIKINNKPDFTKIYRHQKGIAQYNVGHGKRVEVTEKMEQDLPGLYFTGVSYRGVSVNGCIKDAFKVVEKICELETIR